MYFPIVSLYYVINYAPFLNKISLSKSICLLRSVFNIAIYDACKFFLLLAFLGAFEITVHVKHWLILFGWCFDGSELLFKLLCSFHLTSALCLQTLI